MAVSGNTPVIGARTGGRGKDSGSVYVYVAIPGDLNGDGVVDAADLSILGGAWGSSNTIADIDGDGIVNVADFGIIGRNWSAGGGSSLGGRASVPVPGAGVAGLALIGIVIAARRMWTAVAPSV